MSEIVENLILEHLKKMQAELSESRERDREIMTRLSLIEGGIARIAQNESSNYADIVHDRHVVDSLKDRIDRIERRLEING